MIVGVVNCGVRNEIDPALALLSEYLDNNQTANMRIGAVLGLGLAYIGSAREDLREMLMPIVEDSKVSMEVAAMAALALGLIFVGTGEPEITQVSIVFPSFIPFVILDDNNNNHRPVEI